MRRPITIWLALTLLLLRGVTLLYLVARGAVADRYLRSDVVMAVGFFLATALLYLGPKYGRWPAGVFFWISALSGLAAAGKTGASPRDVVIGIIGGIVGFWLGYALLGGTRLGCQSARKYFDLLKGPNQSPDPTLASVTPAAVQPTRLP